MSFMGMRFLGVLKMTLNSGSEPFLKLSNMAVRYGPNIVLKGISGVFKKGSLTAVVGPNGGGKSTLLKAIMNFVPPFKGSILNTFKKTAYLPQRMEMDLHFPLTVDQVVSFGLWKEVGGFSGFRSIHEDQIKTALKTVGMIDYKNNHLNTLSGGQLQRVLFARLILQKAEFILLDEPFTGIDSKTTYDLMRIVELWRKEGRTIIAVLHDLELVKHHFPETLLLSKENMGWGETKNVLTSKALQKIHVCSHSFTFAGQEI